MTNESLDKSSSESVSVFQIGEWTLSVHANRLSRQDQSVDLEYRQTRLLVYLLQRPHQIITKEELIKAIWEKKVVNDESLPVAISQIRKALDDDARTPRFIKTIPGVGYQFIGDAHAEEESNPSHQKNSQLQSTKIIFAALSFAAVGSLGLWILLKQPAQPKITAEIKSPSLCERSIANNEAFSEQEKRKLVIDLRQCIQLEPRNAEAYLKLAEIKMWLFGESVAQAEKAEEVRALLEHSLQINPQLARAHLWLAYVATWGDFDDQIADTEFRKALDLAPNDALIHMHYTHFLLVHKRFAEARKHLNAKREINPLTYAQTDLVWLYMLQGDYVKAEEELERISATETQDEYFHIAAENVYIRMGDEQKAMKQMRWFFAQAKFPEDKIQTIEKIFEQQGLKGVFAHLYETREPAELGQFTPPISLARYALFAEKTEEAKTFLKAAYAQHNAHSQCTMADPFFSAVLKQDNIKLWMLTPQTATNN